MKCKIVTCGKPKKHFQIEKLRECLFNIEIFENGNEEQIPTPIEDMEGAENGETENTILVTRYKYDYYTAVIRATDYGSFIAGIIHLKFSEDDEIALMNKGIADKDNAEYVDYRAFVAEIKELAKQYFSNEE